MPINQNITDKGKNIFQYAMYYGMGLGLFWILKYSLLAAANAGVSERLRFLFYLLNVGTFLLIYIFTLKYNNTEPGKQKSLLQYVLFVTLMCFFASFFEGAAMFAHFKFIDPAYFVKITEPIMSIINELPNGPDEKKILVDIFSGKPIYIIANFIGNTIFGVFLGLIMGLLVNMRKIN